MGGLGAEYYKLLCITDIKQKSNERAEADLYNMNINLFKRICIESTLLYHNDPSCVGTTVLRSNTVYVHTEGK